VYFCEFYNLRCWQLQKFCLLYSPSFRRLRYCISPHPPYVCLSLLSCCSHACWIKKIEQIRYKSEKLTWRLLISDVTRSEGWRSQGHIILVTKYALTKEYVDLQSSHFVEISPKLNATNRGLTQLKGKGDICVLRYLFALIQIYCSSCKCEEIITVYQ